MFVILSRFSCLCSKWIENWNQILRNQNTTPMKNYGHVNVNWHFIFWVERWPYFDHSPCTFEILISTFSLSFRVAFYQPLHIIFIHMLTRTHTFLLNRKFNLLDSKFHTVKLIRKLSNKAISAIICVFSSVFFLYFL